MKRTLRIISNVLVWLVVAVAVATMIFTIVSVRTFNSNERSIFGYHFYIVLSDSMSATDFDAGDLVISKKVDPATLKPGDIISFQSQNADNFGQVITHKIRALTTDEYGNPGFITYGTTTDTIDQTIVTYPFVMGQYKLALPNVGTFFHFLKSPKGYFVCILLPFLLLIGYQAVNCVRAFRRYKGEQMQELEEEKAHIEAERKRSEEMMQQLLQMQQQMNTQTPAPAQTPDVAAMMAELEALRAQVASQNEEKKPETAEVEKEPVNQ